MLLDRLAHQARPRTGARRRRRCRSCSSASGWSRCWSPCRSSGGRCPGSACSPTRASSTWAILALGIGFGTPLAIAGVVLHVLGHALAKALGFYTAIPLLRRIRPPPRSPAGRRAGPARRPPLAMAVSLVSLAGLPPSPLFVSEVMILLGGMDAGLIAVAASPRRCSRSASSASPTLCSRACWGRATRAARRRARSARWRCSRASRPSRCSALTVAAYSLPGSDIVEALIGAAGEPRRRSAPGGRAQEVELVAVEPRAGATPAAARWSEGARFCGALRLRRRRPGGAGARSSPAAPTRVVLAPSPTDRSCETIVDIAPAADWDEREAHDLYGLASTVTSRCGRWSPTRRTLAALDRPGRGGGASTRSPSGRFTPASSSPGTSASTSSASASCSLDPRLFHKHRGLERAAEGRGPAEALAFAQRACGACAVANSVAYAQACEGVLGLLAPRELRRARTLLLELERLYNHLNDIAAICAGVGFATGNMAFAALKERAMRLNAELAGHRFLFGTVAVGAATSSSPAPPPSGRARVLGELRVDAARAWREIAVRASVQARLDGVGVLEREDAAAARRGRPGGAGRRGRASTRARSAPASGTASFAAAVAERSDGRRRRPARDAGGRARAALRAARRAALPSRSHPSAADAGRACAPARRGPGREPERGDGLRRWSPTSQRLGRAAPAHRLLRQLAGAGAGDRAASCCPTSR